MFPGHIMDRSHAVLLLYCFLYVNGQTTVTNEVMRDESVCFETVTHYYSNPEVTGESVLLYTYNNDNVKSEVLTLTCEDEDKEDAEKDLYIEVTSVTLSLPLKGQDDQYCAESQETSYERCKTEEQCNCCDKPDETCMVKVDIEQYSSCNRAKSCNLTVFSQFLSDCPGRQYECEGKKCHSRWADVIYKCRPIDVIPTTSPHDEATSSGGLAWWIILLIILAIIFVIVVVVILYRKKYGDHNEPERYALERSELNPGTEYTDDPEPAEYTLVDKNKKKKKPGNCDAADIPAGNPQRQSEIRLVDNENYAGFDGNAGSEKAYKGYNPHNRDTTNGPKQAETITKPAPPPPSNKPALSTLQQPQQDGGKKQESSVTNKPTQRGTVPSHKQRPAPTKPSMAVAPPKPPAVSSQPRQPATGSSSSEAPPPKPPRLSDTETGNSPTSPRLTDDTYAKTYGHFPAEGRARQPRV